MQNTFHKYFSFEVGGAGVFQLFCKITPRYTRQKILHIVEASYKMPANLNSEYEGAVPGDIFCAELFYVEDVQQELK